MLNHPGKTGAPKTAWDHFDIALGLGADLLPVVPDPNATPSPGSKVKKFGKIPSVYDADGNAHGIKDWQKRTILPGDLERWSTDGRYSLCVRASAVRAIDVDIKDGAAATRAFEILQEHFPEGFPYRRRDGSNKFLVPFLLPGELHKRIIMLASGERIEALGNGQQFLLAGPHEEGMQYEWADGYPYEFPTLTQDQFETIWLGLSVAFGVEPAKPAPAAAEPPAELKRAIAPDDLAALKAALAYPELVAAAADNDLWSRIGYALLSLGAVGRQLWIEFSQKAPNYEPRAPEDWWETHADQTPRTDYTSILSLARTHGYQAVADIEDFGPPAEDPDVAGPQEPGDPVQSVGLPAIPEADGLCTDLRNANRLSVAYGGRHLIVVGGTFYAWTGTHWRRDEGEAARCAASLGKIVSKEVEAAHTKLKMLLEDDASSATAWKEIQEQRNPDTSVKRKYISDEILNASDRLDKLRKWQSYCESESGIRKAFKMLRDMLTRVETPMDTDSYLFNCTNGTIDLRTGELKPHDPKDFISRCAPVAYYPDATAPAFERFLADVMAGDGQRVSFIRRWFGYCATGDTREQKILFHIGGGSNGKTTLINTVSAVLGSYAHTGAPGFLVSTSVDRHPTEIADLAGRRLVTVSETDDGAHLREGLLKQATGSDTLSGRWMRGDFFTFEPTHKLQLLTNYKPVVKGQDEAIWRRLMLLYYTESYGSVDEVESGKYKRIKDLMLPEKLKLEREGILAWIIRGAREWFAEGLNPPPAVLDASAQYRSEQDRVAEFVNLRCIVDPTAQSTWSGDIDGLYPEYTRWCKTCGYHALALNRFQHDIKRVVPSLTTTMSKKREGKLVKTLRAVQGIRVNQDGDGGGVATNG